MDVVQQRIAGVRLNQHAIARAQAGDYSGMEGPGVP